MLRYGTIVLSTGGDHMHNSALIVLVHGALSDASIWRDVVPRLQAGGYEVHAPAMPLRGLASDAAYLSAYLETLDGPVVLAGHSYGGSIISHPDFGHDGVSGLVFVSAFAPDTGESTGELNGRWPGSLLGETTTVVRESPDGAELYLKVESFGEVYAGDLNAAMIAVLAAAQRPINPDALGESLAGAPAWRSLPSWSVISTNDSSLPAQAQRAMAKRAGSHSVEVAASHASPLSQPEAVAELILRAAE